MSFLHLTNLSLRAAILAVACAVLLPQVTSADTLPYGVTERQTCDGYSVDIKGFGAGMMQNPDPIQTTQRRVSYISATSNCAVVQWETNTPAATQVIFSEFEHEPVTISLDVENFGYPHASTQNNAGEASHTAILSGLQPGKAYAYRLVSRSHPTAIPTISDPHVLIAGPAIVVPTPVTPVISTPPPVVAPPTPQFDAEKFPITPTTPTTEIKEDPVATETEENKEDAEKVPSALNAISSVGSTLGNREWMLWDKIKGFFDRLVPHKDRLSLESNIGLFEKDRYIIPTLFFLGLLFLFQRFILPAMGMVIHNPLLYWLCGAAALAVVSATFMLYYVTLIAIALFLGLLAWYLLQSVPEDVLAIDTKSTTTTTEEKDKK